MTAMHAYSIIGRINVLLMRESDLVCRVDLSLKRILKDFTAFFSTKSRWADHLRSC